MYKNVSFCTICVAFRHNIQFTPVVVKSSAVHPNITLIPNPFMKLNMKYRPPGASQALCSAVIALRSDIPVQTENSDLCQTGRRGRLPFDWF